MQEIVDPTKNDKGKYENFGYAPKSREQPVQIITEGQRTRRCRSAGRKKKKLMDYLTYEYLKNYQYKRQN